MITKRWPQGGAGAGSGVTCCCRGVQKQFKQAIDLARGRLLVGGRFWELGAHTPS